MKKRLKSYKFWVAVSGAIVVFGKTLAEALGVEFDQATINNVLLSFCGVLSAIGIIEKPAETATTQVAINEVATEKKSENDN